MTIIAVRVLLILQTFVALAFSVAAMASPYWSESTRQFLPYTDLLSLGAPHKSLLSLSLVAGGCNFFSFIIALIDICVTRRSEYKSGVTCLSCLSATLCILTTLAWVVALSLIHYYFVPMYKGYSFWLGAIASVANFQVVLTHFTLVSQRRNF